MVMILEPLSAILAWSYAGSFTAAHTACLLCSPYTCALILVAFSCVLELLHQLIGWQGTASPTGVLKMSVRGDLKPLC